MSFNIESISESLNFSDGTRSLEVVVAIGRERVRVPVEQDQADFLLKLRKVAAAAVSENKMTKGARVDAPPAAAAPEEDDDAPTPIRMGTRLSDDEEEEL